VSLGGTVVRPDGPWQLAATSPHQNLVFAAAVPLRVGGPLAALGS
jgi:hypothetical protein